MKISLVLTGADRHKDLARFYSSISGAIVSENFVIELVFVNQGLFVPPVTIDAFESLSHIELKCNRLPLSIARNIGMQKVTGDIIGFPDDDCWYSPLVLVQVANYFEANPTTSAICTNVYDPVAQCAYGGRPSDIHTAISYYNLFKLPISVGIFIRIQAFKSVGFNFDEKLGAGTPLGSGEETDLIYRLIKNGFKVDYVGSIQVFHPVPKYQEADVEKFHTYGLGFGYLNGRIVRDGECRVLYYLALVLLRSLAGSVVNLHRTTTRRMYWNRLLGIVQGFVRGVRGL